MAERNTYRDGPDRDGHFGMFGGRYVAETLMPLILEVERAYRAAQADPSFRAELDYYLKDYVGRMKEGQKDVYYLTGESRSMVENSPLLEAFRKKNYEVLYLVDPVDEVLVQYLTEFDGKKLQSAVFGFQQVCKFRSKLHQLSRLQLLLLDCQQQSHASQQMRKEYELSFDN